MSAPRRSLTADLYPPDWLSKFGRGLQRDEIRLVGAYRGLTPEQRGSLLQFLGGLTLARAGVVSARRLDGRLRRQHPCATDPEAGFQQIPPAGDVRQWRCLGCDTTVTLEAQ